MKLYSDSWLRFPYERVFVSAKSCYYGSLFFFFQAEDGIRDHCVTGVQTCALPIWTVCTAPSGPMTFASVGARRSNALSASEEPRRLRISIQWPKSTKVTSIAAAS